MMQEYNQFEQIQSEQNQWLKRCKALQQKKYRQQYGQFVAEGLRFVAEAIENHAAEVILIDESHAALAEQLPKTDTPIYMVKKGLLEKALNTVNPQGIAAIARQMKWEWQSVAEFDQIVVIDGVQDPGNLGTIMRTALASGTQAMLCLKGTVDLYNYLDIIDGRTVIQGDERHILVSSLCPYPSFGEDILTRLTLEQVLHFGSDNCFHCICVDYYIYGLKT